jgi:hypothetical protein
MAFRRKRFARRKFPAGHGKRKPFLHRKRTDLAFF